MGGMTDEMVERDRLLRKIEVWREVSDQTEPVSAILDAFEKYLRRPAALAAMPGGVDVKPLDWQTTYVDRGDGQKEESGWEADNGFNQWYSVEMYFGTDSYGWQVKFDCDVIADHDDPERAKAAAQEHFASRILSRLTPSIGAEGWRLVPVEPTPQMRQAFHAAHEEYEGGSGVAPDLQWQAMLAAAPAPPTAQEG